VAESVSVSGGGPSTKPDPPQQTLHPLQYSLLKRGAATVAVILISYGEWRKEITHLQNYPQNYPRSSLQ
jgi:hypothetical protein